jgi:hypothetical protein
MYASQMPMYLAFHASATSGVVGLRENRDCGDFTWS